MEQIPGYKIINMIGENGMATVYKRLVSLDHPVAIKILKQKLIAPFHCSRTLQLS